MKGRLIFLDREEEYAIIEFILNKEKANSQKNPPVHRPSLYR